MIYILDAVMGTGKTTAAINYMNEHPDQKFIYITPFLEEVSRVKKKCRGFYNPYSKVVMNTNYSIPFSANNVVILPIF